MTTTVTLAGQHLAMTSMRGMSAKDGTAVLHAAAVLWADCAPLTQAGIPLGFDEDGLTRLAVVRATADRAGRVANLVLVVGDQEELDSAERVEFEVSIPVTVLGLSVALSDSPAPFHVFLFDGRAPRRAGFAEFTVADAAAIIDVTTQAARQVLPGRVTTALTDPMDVADPQAEAEVELVRALLYPAIAGVAVGHLSAFNHLAAMGEQAHRVALAGSDGEADPKDLDRMQSLLDVVDYALEQSQQTVHDSDVQVNYEAFPAALEPLRAKIVEMWRPEIVAALSGGGQVWDVALQFGLPDTVLVAAVMLAQRAWAIQGDDRAVGLSVCWVIAEWMTGFDDADEPYWALPSTGPGLAHHDTAVLTDLMSVQPGGADSEVPGEILVEFLHTLTAAVLDSQRTSQQMTQALQSNDVRPANLADVMVLVQSLLDAAAELTAGAGAVDGLHTEQGACLACAGIESVGMYSWPVPRLAAAATSAMALLADLDAADAGWPIGEPQWVQHRMEFLSHWLNLAAA